MYIKNGSQKIYYVTRKGPADAVRVFILVHGIGATHRHELIAALGESLKATGDVIEFDVRGYGKSSGRVQDRKLRTFIDDIATVTSWAKRQPRYKGKKVIIVGHSLGALATMIAAARHPSLCDGVVLIAANSDSDQLYHWYKDSGMMREYKKYIVMQFEMAHRLAKDFWKERLLLAPMKFARRLKTDALLVYGSADPVNSPVAGRQLFKVIKGKKIFKIVQGARHSFKRPQDKKAVIASINLWLQKNSL